MIEAFLHCKFSTFYVIVCQRVSYSFNHINIIWRRILYVVPSTGSSRVFIFDGSSSGVYYYNNNNK